MTIPDETLMAYVDGELEFAAMAEVEAAIAGDPSVARRVDAWRAQGLRVRGAYDSVLGEPVPPRLVAAAGGVSSLSPPRRRATYRWGLRETAAMAASVLLGALVTWSVLRVPQSGMIEVSGRGMAAGSALARALSDDLAGEVSAGPVRVGMSFRNRTGSYCRTFSLSDPAAPASAVTAGLACRGTDRWELELAVRAHDGGESGGAYRQAGAPLPAELMRAVDGMIEGDPLDAREEQAVRARGWAD